MAGDQDPCFYSREGCREPATVTIFCHVEGRDTKLCHRHIVEWRNQSNGDEMLSKHCPRCAPSYIARRESQAYSPRIAIADEPISGPLADAISEAMHAEGILVPVRQRVLRRLAANTDAYVAAIMSRNSMDRV